MCFNKLVMFLKYLYLTDNMVWGSLTWNPKDYVPGLITWNFKYKAEDGQRVQTLTKSDVEGVWGRNQIKIKQSTVLMRCSEWAQGINVSVTLPSRVWKIIVMQYGGNILCYAIQYGKKVYPGQDLEAQSSNPFKEKTIKRRRVKWNS